MMRKAIVVDFEKLGEIKRLVFEVDELRRLNELAEIVSEDVHARELFIRIEFVGMLAREFCLFALLVDVRPSERL